MAAKRVNGVLCPPVCERFFALDDVAFERAAAEAIARLEMSNSREDAQRIYDHDVLPLEMERIRREAVRRAVELDLLFVTVGAQPNSPTLAVLASPARFVVLLHTEAEKESADATIRALGLDATEASLQLIGDGKDPAELYCAVFAEWTKRGRKQNVGVDITGGLKTMSAAAAAASFALPHGTGTTYYINADHARVHGREWWVRECRIQLANPFQVFGEIPRATGRELLKTRQYAAAAAVYGQLYEEEDHSRAQLAAAYDALERLDLETAAKGLGQLYKRLEDFARDPRKKNDDVVRQRTAIRANADGARKLVQLIGLTGKDDPVRNLAALRSLECLELGEMLLARAERAAPDVAALLSYRCLELVPQRRLAIRGNVDPSAVDWPVIARAASLEIAALIEKYNIGNKDEQRLALDALPAKISSVQSYRLLHVAFPDDVTKAMPVQAFAGVGEVRNRGVLAHGLKKLDAAAADGIRQKARKLFDTLLDVEKVSESDRAALRQRHAFVEVE